MSADPNHEDHEHEAHEGSVNHGLRIPSPLSPDAEKTTGLHGGLLINFRVPLLKDGIRRVVA